MMKNICTSYNAVVETQAFAGWAEVVIRCGWSEQKQAAAN